MFLDSLVIQLRNMVNGAVPQVDQASMFYRLRPAGLDYQPPFSIANVAHCPGVSTPIEVEEPIDFYIAILDEVKSFEDEYTKDRSLFFANDFDKYEIFGDVLADE